MGVGAHHIGTLMTRITQNVSLKALQKCPLPTDIAVINQKQAASIEAVARELACMLSQAVELLNEHWYMVNKHLITIVKECLEHRSKLFWFHVAAIVFVLKDKLVLARIIHLHTADPHAMCPAGCLDALVCLTLFLRICRVQTVLSSAHFQIQDTWGLKPSR